MNTSKQISKDPSDRIPVVILNGFLGSGKTTLFRSLLAQARKNNIAVSTVVNDMSELDVDGALIARTDIVEEDNHIFQSIHSCVISSKKGIKKLGEALEKLLAYQQPDLIIIETSGSGHPLPLIEYFKTRSDLKLTGVLALVDSLMLAQDYENGRQLVPMMRHNLKHQKRDMINLLVEQIMFCSHLVLTKADRLKNIKLTDIAKFVQPINPYVTVHGVLYGNLSIDQVLEMPEYNYHRTSLLAEELKPVLEAEEEGDRPYNMATRVIKDERPFHPQRLWEACHNYLDQKVYRSKGFFWLASRDKLSLLWNQAAGSINLELIGYWRSGILEEEDSGLLDMEIKELKRRLAEESGRFGDRHCHLTVIGDKAQVDRFTEALKACFLSEEEIQHYQNGGKFPDPWPKNIVKVSD